MGLEPTYRGDTYQFSVDLSAYGISIEGHVITLTLKVEEDDTDAEAVLQYAYTVPAGTDADAGLATVIVSSVLTDDVEPGEYHYDVEWNQGGSPAVKKTIFASGEQPDGSEVEKFKVLTDYTRT